MFNFEDDCEAVVTQQLYFHFFVEYLYSAEQWVHQKLCIFQSQLHWALGSPVSKIISYLYVKRCWGTRTSLRGISPVKTDERKKSIFPPRLCRIGCQPKYTRAMSFLLPIMALACVVVAQLAFSSCKTVSLSIRTYKNVVENIDYEDKST